MANDPRSTPDYPQPANEKRAKLSPRPPLFIRILTSCYDLAAAVLIAAASRGQPLFGGMAAFSRRNFERTNTVGLKVGIGQCSVLD